MAENTYKTFTLSDKVTVEQVTFKNRYGIAVAADLYLSSRAMGIQSSRNTYMYYYGKISR